MVQGWLEMVADKFVRYNKDWIPLLFESYAHLDAERVAEEGGYRYVFKTCRLKTAPDTSQGICGDVGGKTAKGLPCRKRSRKDGDGRCATHPYGTVVVRVHDGETPCDKIRPIGDRLPWSAFSVEADGFDMTSEPNDFIKCRFVSAEHVWSEMMLSVCKDVGVEANATLVIDNDKELPAEPLWPSSFIREMFPDAKRLRLNGQDVKRGYTLRDYGVIDQSRIQLETF